MKKLRKEHKNMYDPNFSDSETEQTEAKKVEKVVRQEHVQYVPPKQSDYNDVSRANYNVSSLTSNPQGLEDSIRT